MSQENNLNNEPILKPSDDDENYDDFLSDFDIAQLLVVGAQNIVWVVLLLVISLSGAFLYNRYTKAVYESSSIIKLDSKSDAGVLGLKALEDQHTKVSNMSVISGEMEILKSPLLYKRLVNIDRLKVNYFANGKILFEERYANSPFKIYFNIKNPAYYNKKFDVKFLSNDEYVLTYSNGEKEISITYLVDETIKTDDFEIKLSLTSAFSEESIKQTYFFIINSEEAILEYLKSNLSVSVVNVDASTIKVSFKDHDRIKARDIVNLIDSVYLLQTVENKSQAQEQTIAFLESTLDTTEALLTNYEMKLESFIKKNKTVDVKGDLGKLAEKMEEIDNEKLQLRIQVSLLNDLKELIVMDKDLNTFIPTISEIPDPNLVEVIKKLNELQQEREHLLVSQKENTYVIRSKNLAIDNLKNTILELISQNKRMLFQKMSELNSKVVDLERMFIDLPSKETEYTRLKRFYGLYEKYYLLLMEKKAEFGIAKAGTVPNFVVLAPATIPETPIFPNKIFLYMTGGGIGLFLGVLLIFFRYFLHNTISTQKELEKVVKAPVLGGIPEYTKENLEVSKLVVDKNPKSAISEALRSIRTNLEFICPNQKKKLIAVTSTVSGEGKTFVAANLAGVIAMSNQKVILLDLDMRKPKVHLAFDKENLKGMSTILIGKHTFEECVHKTPIENLEFVSAGPTPPNPSELILRPEFDALLKKLHEVYDVIFIDTPPVGLVTDGVLIMKKADIPLYVVRANYSKKGVKRNINKLISTTGFTRMSVILNALKSINTYGYGGYGYGYGYGYYEGDKDKKGNIFKRLFSKK